MSQLIKGRLVCKEGRLANQAVEFMFNPTEYSISKSNNWEKRRSASKNVADLKFSGGAPRELTLELFFDSYLPREGVSQGDVRKITNQLFNFMMIDDDLKKSNSRMGRPPKCRFVWGQDTRHHFDCYITSCKVSYNLFDGESGLPVRAKASLSLKEERDGRRLLPTNPTSLGEPGRKIRIIQEGDRLDWIAYQEYGDATTWRLIAEANHLSNPLALRPGMSLIIPSR